MHPPEFERLRAQLQANHIAFIESEISLIVSFLGMSRTEYDLGFVEAGAKSFRHAKEAIAGAGKGLSRIESISQRAAFEQKLQELAMAVQDCAERGRTTEACQGDETALGREADGDGNKKRPRQA